MAEGWGEDEIELRSPTPFLPSPNIAYYSPGSTRCPCENPPDPPGDQISAWDILWTALLIALTFGIMAALLVAPHLN